jgi:hypothetical protein
MIIDDGGWIEQKKAKKKTDYSLGKEKQKPSFKCDICVCVFSTKVNLNKHMSEHEPKYI